MKIKIDSIGYIYPNLIFSFNNQTVLIQVKSGRGKKWIKLGNIESVNVYPTIENDISQFKNVPVRDIEKLIRDVFNNFPTRMVNTNEPARNLIWGWRNGIFEDKSGMLV